MCEMNINITLNMDFDPACLYCYMTTFTEHQVVFWLINILSGRKLTFVDVGSQFGEYTRLARQILAKNSLIYSFDIEPQGDYGATKVAIGAKDGNAHYSECYISVDDTSGQQIEMLSLDSIFKNVPVDFIKIDVEGYEYEVLKGAKEILTRDKPMMMVEIHTEFLKRYESSEVDVIQFLISLGYGFIQINHDSRLGHYLFVHKDKLL